MPCFLMVVYDCTLTQTAYPCSYGQVIRCWGKLVAVTQGIN
jgi:hypothetical protein